MKHGFIKVAAVTPDVRVADTAFNGEQIRKAMKESTEAGAKIVVFPELCITGYTCGDLFWQEALLRSAKEELFRIAEESAKYDGIFFVGLPLEFHGKLYNAAAGISAGEILGFVPKSCMPNYNEFYELRHFASGADLDECIEFPDKRADPGDDAVRSGGRAESSGGMFVAIGTDLIFYCEALPKLRIAVEICEDLWSPQPPSIRHALAGADIIVNLSASDEATGKDAYRKSLVEGQSARLICGYIYASAGDGESTQDVVYSGHSLIAENGHTLAESKRFSNGILYSELDVERLMAERRRVNTFPYRQDAGEYTEIPFSLEICDTKLSRKINAAPFVPGNPAERSKRCDEILNIQAMGLKKRLEHTHCKCAVVGISGGLDSTLALLVAARAFDLLGQDRSGILAVTMPGFGTTDRTYENAVNLIQCLGARFMEVSIRKSVLQHFEDIGQDPEKLDVIYENAQARERTQILMDIANKENGMVIGTGDLSELVLGWATYNGDHMSMYGVNSSVPKTLVRHLVRFYADTCGDGKLSEVLLDVLDTPVSPELLPPENGQISQKTEDLVGPYELHDFFLYYVLRFGFTPEKVYRLAGIAFAGIYGQEFILKWLKTFYQRFFAQQFKRSCLPDGPKVGTVAVSPRGDLRMPSDACVRIWMEELDGLVL